MSSLDNRPYDYLLDRIRELERELAEARERIKGYEAQARSFHEEYRRKCDVETKELQERLSDTQHRNGANIVRLERAEAADGFDDGKGAQFDELMVEIVALREQLEDCSAVVDRQQKQLDRNQEKEDTGTTHWAGCSESGPEHYKCALLEIARLRDTITNLRAVLEKAQFSYERGFDDGFILRKEKDEGANKDTSYEYTDGYEDGYKAGMEEKKPWVGLTDEDKWRIEKEVTYNQFETAGEYADRVQAATEAKLKEKNT